MPRCPELHYRSTCRQTDSDSPHLLVGCRESLSPCSEDYGCWRRVGRGSHVGLLELKDLLWCVDLVGHVALERRVVMGYVLLVI